MKKLIALFLFFVMIFCGSGFYISYQLNLYSIHQHQKDVILHSNIFRNTIVTFSLPLNYRQNNNLDIRFMEDNEIMFNGKMYDIINQSQLADSIFISCIPDKIEDAIRAEASNQINETKGASTQTNFTAFKYSVEPFIPQSGEGESYLILKNSAYLLLNDDGLFKSYLNVPSPPPWSDS